MSFVGTGLCPVQAGRSSARSFSGSSVVATLFNVFSKTSNLLIIY
jgi:hypothetical protein